MQHARSLVVLTLLQLCRAEIPEALPEWYAANLINDAGYPKPITEIFTTPETFSSKNPIIVTSTPFNSHSEEVFSTSPTGTTTDTIPTEMIRSSEDATRRVIPLREDGPLSSQPRNTPIQAYQTPAQRENSPMSSKPLDIPIQMNQPPSQRENRPTSSKPLDIPMPMNQPPPQRENSPTSSQPLDISMPVNQPPPLRENSPTSSQPLDISMPMNQPPPQRENSPTSSQPLDISMPVNQPPLQRKNQPTSPQPLDKPVQMRQPQPQRDNPPSSSPPLDMMRQMYQPPPQQIQVLVAQPQIPSSQQIESSPKVPPVNLPIPQLPPAPIPPSPQIQFPTQPVNPQTTGQPNYFLIYQQAPLSIQQYPESVSQFRQSSPPTTQTTTQTAETERTTRETTRPTNTPPSPTTTETQTTQLSTTHTLPTSHSSPPRNIRQEQIGYWQDVSPALGARNFNPPISSSIFQDALNIPCFNSSSSRKNATAPTTIAPLQRQSGRSGLTIRVTAPRGSITNIKINPSTTTKKPSTRRSQRRKGNNYNNCVESCKGKKEPLCAAPLAVLPIDPNNLRGFPSICHMACHNSFRKNQPYEKVMDGRCSRLRTRIRTFDQNKLKREELNKAQYTVLNNIPETIVQVIQNERSGVY